MQSLSTSTFPDSPSAFRKHFTSRCFFLSRAFHRHRSHFSLPLVSVSCLPAVIHLFCVCVHLLSFTLAFSRALTPIRKSETETQTRWHGQRVKIERFADREKQSKRENPEVQFAVILLSEAGRAGSRLQIQWVPLVPDSPCPTLNLSLTAHCCLFLSVCVCAVVVCCVFISVCVWGFRWLAQ